VTVDPKSSDDVALHAPAFPGMSRKPTPDLHVYPRAMAGILVYIPDQSTDPPPERLRELGLDWITAHSFLATAGPDNTRGAFLAPHAADRKGRVARCSYDPERQRWTKVQLGTGDEAARPQSIFLGYWLADRPQPMDLARRELVDGHPVKLADGNEWLVPVARRWGNHLSPLPQRLAIGPNGQWVSEVLPQYQQLARDAQAYFELIFSAGPDRPYDQWLDVVCAALAVNYQLDRYVVSALGLLTTSVVHPVLEALVDTASLVAELEARKKKEGEAGGEASSATPPAT